MEACRMSMERIDLWKALIGLLERSVTVSAQAQQTRSTSYEIALLERLRIRDLPRPIQEAASVAMGASAPRRSRRPNQRESRDPPQTEVSSGRVASTRFEQYSR
jgi:hypothetical protein